MDDNGSSLYHETDENWLQAIRNYKNGSSSINFEFPAPGDYYELDRQTVRCKGTLTIDAIAVTTVTLINL